MLLLRLWNLTFSSSSGPHCSLLISEGSGEWGPRRTLQVMCFLGSLCEDFSFQTEWCSTFLYSSCSAASNSLVKDQKFEVLAWAAQGKPVPIPALSHFRLPSSHSLIYMSHIHTSHFYTHAHSHFSLSLSHMSLSHILTHIQILLLHIHFTPSLSHS